MLAAFFSTTAHISAGLGIRLFFKNDLICGSAASGNIYLIDEGVAPGEKINFQQQ